MLIAPKTFNIKSHPKLNLERVKYIKNVISDKYIPKNNSDLFYGQKL